MKRRTLVLLLTLGLATAACGGSDESDGGVATLETEDTAVAVADPSLQAADEVDAEEAMMQLAACLRDQGLDIEDPTVDAEGNVQFGRFRVGPGDGTEPAADRATVRAAMDACEEQLEGVILGFGGRDFDPMELEDSMVEYAACMRENGYDMDDPDFSSFGPGNNGESGEGGPGGPFGEINPEDPDFVAANEACGEILGGLPRGPGQGRGNG
jgi:hypothetical protein